MIRSLYSDRWWMGCYILVQPLRTRLRMSTQHGRHEQGVTSWSDYILTLIRIRMWIYDNFSTSVNIRDRAIDTVIRCILIQQGAPPLFSSEIGGVCALWAHLVYSHDVFTKYLTDTIVDVYDRHTCDLLWYISLSFNPLKGTLKLQTDRPFHSNTVIGTLADGRWWVDCYIWYSEEGPGGLRPRPVRLRCTKCNSPPINGQCTNFILFDVAL